MKDQPVLILGLGASGLSMARWCAREGARVTVADTREAPPQLVALQGECPDAVFARYLLLPHIPGAGELLIFCAAMAGAGLAFLWFNTHPAQVFMGDVGALALGGALGTIAVIVRQEILLAIMGGIFVVEALSVMLQVSYFKYTKKRFGEGRRLFQMAPLHHHFEKAGMGETKIVVRFWIGSVVLAVVAVASLKVR